MYGAIIVAAGKEKKPNQFNPLLKFGNITVIERIVATLKSAKIEQIVIVTGNNAKELENKLKHYGVIFLRNDEYLTTQMFDSAKIGFAYLKGKCQKIIFTPANLPLYTKKTVEKLLASNSDVAYPLYQGRRGHPVCFQEKLLDQIIQYTGNQGLRGALHHFDKIEEIDVDDQGIVYNDTSSLKQQKLLQIHNHQMYRSLIDVMIVKENLIINHEIAQLLHLIEMMGSISDASSKMNMSYSKCLKLIKQLENQIQKPIVIRKQGGLQGGYAYLSDDGKELLKRFLQFENKLVETAEQLFVEEFSDFLGS